MHTIDTTARMSSVEGFSEPLSIIAPDGTRSTCEALDAHVDDIDDQRLADLYVDMSIVRRFDQEAFAMTRQGDLALWAPLLGQEAAQVGSVRALRENDWVFPSYREHAAPLLRGADFGQSMRVWKTFTYAGWDPHEIKVANTQIIIGAQALHGTGFAMGAKLRGLDDVAMTCFGDGATSQGDVSEAMVFASAYQAPVIFLCQNNGYAISEPVEVQAKHPLAQRAVGFDIPALRVDGNDVLAVLAAVRLAAERARAGDGPTFVEAVTYRMGPHTTTDDPTRYRREIEQREWADRDPLLRIERHLEQRGVSAPGLREEAKVHADRLAKELRAAVRAAEPADSDHMFDGLYEVETARLRRQREQHAALRASLAKQGAA